MGCIRHNINRIVETPDPERPGWLSGRCRDCGQWLGYRLVPSPPRQPASVAPPKPRRRKAS
jgi:hypothetical protein